MTAFWSRVAMIPGHACWEWIGSIAQGSGYGRIPLGTRQHWAYAHRVSWQLHRGPIPGEMCVLHRCDNRTCVNPDHLFLGTRTDNAADRDAKGRTCRGEDRPHRLTRIQVDEIRRRYKRGNGFALAAEFGVARATISNIVTGHSWRQTTETDLHGIERHKG